MVINQWNIALLNWMQRARHGFISGEHDVSEAREGGREALALSAVHRFVNFMVYYFELFGTL